MIASGTGERSSAGSPGRRLRLARKELGLSQATLASAIGIAQSTLADYEADKHLVPLPALLAIEYRFGIDHAWVLTGEGEPFL